MTKERCIEFHSMMKNHEYQNSFIEIISKYFSKPISKPIRVNEMDNQFFFMRTKRKFLFMILDPNRFTDDDLNDHIDGKVMGNIDSQKYEEILEDMELFVREGKINELLTQM